MMLILLMAALACVADKVKDVGLGKKDSTERKISARRIVCPAPGVLGRGLGRAAAFGKGAAMTDATMELAAFGQLAAALRPRLHRYCARMVGSALEGEDVVQEALAKAAEATPAAGAIERPESWLFRIAHNAALDALRRRKRQAALRSEIDLGAVVDATASADVRVAAEASLAAFMTLSATERSSVILVDVLGDSLSETAEVLGVSL